MRWTNRDQKALDHVTRRQMYGMFIKEGNRFKNEKKYGFSSFVNNLAKFLTGRKVISDQMEFLANKLENACALGSPCEDNEHGNPGGGPSSSTSLEPFLAYLILSLYGCYHMVH